MKPLGTNSLINESEPKSQEKGMPIEECIKKANELIEENGICLFLFDVKGSRTWRYSETGDIARNVLKLKLIDIINVLNEEYDEYFPENNLASQVNIEKGFNTLIGDGSWAGINNSEVIPKIVETMKVRQESADINFAYAVAKDGYDEAAKKIFTGLNT